MAEAIGRPRTPVEAAIQRRQSEEADRLRLLRWAKGQFTGGAILGGLAATGAAVLGTGGELPLSSAVMEAGEGVAVASSIGLITRGTFNLHRAADASRNAARLVQALVQHELAAGQFIGPGSETFAEERFAAKPQSSGTPGTRH